MDQGTKGKEDGSRNTKLPGAVPTIQSGLITLKLVLRRLLLEVFNGPVVRVLRLH